MVEERVVDERVVTPGEGKGEGAKASKKDGKAVEPPPEDEGPGLKWVWLVPDVGYSYINLKSFSETNLALVDTEKSGLMAGAGAGIRLVFLTAGLRARHHFAWQMWQVMADVGLHFKFGRVDPYLGLRAGYDTIGTSLGQAVGNATGSVNVDVSGFNAGAALGLDYFVTNAVTLGIEGSGDFLFLTRPTPPIPANLPPAQQAAIKANPLYQQSGSSVGFGGVFAVRFGVHF